MLLCSLLVTFVQNEIFPEPPPTLPLFAIFQKCCCKLGNEVLSIVSRALKPQNTYYLVIIKIGEIRKICLFLSDKTEMEYTTWLATILSHKNSNIAPPSTLAVSIWKPDACSANREAECKQSLKQKFANHPRRHIVKAKYKTFQATTSTYYNYMYTLSSLDHVATLPTIPIYLITSLNWCQTVNVVDCKVEWERPYPPEILQWFSLGVHVPFVKSHR